MCGRVVHDLAAVEPGNDDSVPSLCSGSWPQLSHKNSLETASKSDAQREQQSDCVLTSATLI